MTRIVFIIYQVRKNKRFYKRLLATCKNTTNTKSELKTADTHKKKQSGVTSMIHLLMF